MSKHFKVEILDGALAEHEAVVTWNSLQSQESVPDRISVLYREEKTQVYCLHGLRPDGSNVIAKRCERGTALIERKMYEEILHGLPISTLGYFGYADDDSDDAFCWLFLEDAGTQMYSPLSEEDRVLAGRWLGALHISAGSAPLASSLPDRGPAYYHEQLHKARCEMDRGLSNPALTAENIELLKTMILQLDLLERRWPEVTEVCDRVPRTLVHGDLVVKNVRLQDRAGQRSLLVMDWEFAGWGIPAVDLAQFGWGSRTLGPDLETYFSVIKPAWPHFDVEDIRRLADVGRMFRLVVTIAWASESLSTPWFDDEIRDLGKFHNRLTAFVESVGWV